MRERAGSSDELQRLAEGYTAAWCGGDLARGFMTAFPDMRVVMDGLSAESHGHFDEEEYLCQVGQ